MKLTLFPTHNSEIRVPMSKSKAMDIIRNNNINTKMHYFDKHLDGDTITLTSHGEILVNGSGFLPLTTLTFKEKNSETIINLEFRQKQTSKFMVCLWFAFAVLWLAIALFISLAYTVFRHTYPFVLVGLGFLVGGYYILHGSFRESTERMEKIILDALKDQP